jgi:hypothetical protein
MFLQKLIFFYLLSILLIGCDSSNDTASNFDKKNIKFHINDNSEKVNLGEIKKKNLFTDIPKTVPYSKSKIYNYANLILKDSIVVIHSLKPHYIPFETINWKENPENNSTWKLYYENLFFVSILNHAYYESKDIKYHEKAKKYINSYIKKHATLNDSTSKYSWYDHSVAFRTLHLLQTIANELDLPNSDITFIEKSFDHIDVSINYMLDSKNYRAHNHSLMMDRTLLYLSNIFNSNSSLSTSIRNIASTRALNNFDKIIDDTGLAKEHSIGYHIFNHKLYNTIFNLIGKDSINSAFRIKHLKRNDIVLQLVKPDLTFPIWGDSGLEKLTPHLIKEFGNDQRLQEVFNGQRLNSIVNFENNIATFRTKTNDKGYLAFFANYYSRVHKHHDDLSFVFQTLNLDILIDLGYYGYDKVYRPKLTSIYGHNTVVVNDSSYLIKDNKQYSKLTSYTKEDGYEIITGEHNFYEDILIRRSVYFIKPNVIVIKDKSNNIKKTKSLTQVFNFGKDLKNIVINKKQTIVSFPDNIKLKIKCFNNDLTVFDNDTYQSRKTFTLTPIKQLLLRTEKSEIVTVLEVTSNKYETPVSNITIENGLIYYEKGGQLNSIKMIN